MQGVGGVDAVCAPNVGVASDWAFVSALAAYRFLLNGLDELTGLTVGWGCRGKCLEAPILLSFWPGAGPICPLCPMPWLLTRFFLN